jgi:RNA polymerase sigma-70 factor (ECF subfamily)
VFGLGECVADDFISAVSWPVPPSHYNPDTSIADLPDEELMVNVRAGNNHALAVLMKRHAHSVLAVGRRVLHDQGAAEELVQDVFLRVYRHARMFDPRRGTLRSWLITIAYNEAYRTRHRLQVRHIYDDQTVADCLEVVETPSSPEYHVLLAQSEDKLRQAFKGLSPKQAQTLELFFFEGQTLRDIAETTGEKLDNVRHYYYRALEQMKEVIARHHIEIIS